MTDKEVHEKIQKTQRLERWQWILVGVTLFLLCLGLFGQYQSNQSDIKRKEDSDRILSNAVQQIIKENDKQTQQLSEYGESIICILALLNPSAVPGSDPVKCRVRVTGINNTDGTFLSGTWPPLPPEAGSKSLQSMQSTDNPQPTAPQSILTIDLTGPKNTLERIRP